MKKMKLLGVVAVAGLLGLSARASAPADFDIVSVKLTAMVQTNIDTKIVKIKITTKDVLTLIGSEFTDQTAQITASGAKLVVDSFLGDTFAVLDKNNEIIVADAGESPEGVDDSYEINIGTEDTLHVVQAIKDTDSKFSDTITTPGFVEFSNGSGSINGDIFGLTTIKQTESDTKRTESFKITGTEDVEVNGIEGVLTGTVSGSGKDNEDVEFFD